MVTLLMVGVSGQQPNKKLPPPPAPLLPVEQGWLTDLPSAPAAGGAMDDERVYIPLQDGGTVALERETGKIVWTSSGESSWAPLAIDGTLILFRTNYVAGRDQQTGDLLWQTETPGKITGQAIAAAGRILVPVETGKLLAIDATNGHIAWESAFDRALPPVAVATDGTTVFVTGKDAVVAALGLSDGRLSWEARLSGTLSAPAIGRDVVLIGSTTNALYALDAGTGRIRWAWTSEMIGGDVIGAVVDRGDVYFASLDNILHAVNRGNGNQRWKQALPTRPIAAPVAFGGVVAVFGVSPAIATFNARTGTALGTYVIPTATGATTPGMLQGQPLLDTELRPFRVALVVMTADGRVIGLRPTGMLFRETPPAPLVELPGKPLTRERSPLAH
jgi:outer membrane protein assembly factor BamB